MPCVYLITDDTHTRYGHRHYKIGFTRGDDPQARIAEINASTQALPFRAIRHWNVLSEKMARELEKLLHAKYSAFRVSEAREIFAIADDESILVAQISAAVTTYVSDHPDWRQYVAELAETTAYHSQQTAREELEEWRTSFMVPMCPSPALAKVVGDELRTRTEITRAIWDYIKKNRLQDPINRRLIRADSNLQVVFGGKKVVSMFEMTVLVSNHLEPANQRLRDVGGKEG